MTKKELLFTTSKMHSELVFNMTKLEGNPYTYPEVKTLLDGITVGGHKLSDQAQVLRVSAAWEELRNQVAKGTFSLTEANFIHFNQILADGEALVVGHFRTGQVYIAGVEDYMPPKAEELGALFEQMLDDFHDSNDDVQTKAFKLFLNCARYQFFFDGNKRTAQIMMNGFLLSSGYPPVSIPAKNKPDYDSKIIHFYETNDMRPMLAFLHELAKSERYGV